MCNLYRMTKNSNEVARWFDVQNAAVAANLSAEIYPGYPGLVIAGGSLRRMIWGFPLQAKGARGQPLKPKPVNNARSDKLGGAFWRSSFVERRCLIVLNGWAEAEGMKGAKTRSWFSMLGGDLFTAAGIWRNSAEWGDVYSMVMTGCEQRYADVHDRMPVLIGEDDRPVWTDAPPEDAFTLCRPWPGPLDLERTSEPWAGRG